MSVNSAYVKNLTNHGQVYNDLDPKIVAARNYALKTVRAYNNKVYHQNEYDYSILKQLFDHLGKDPYIEPNFYCEFGFNLSIGDNFFANHDVILMDCAPITIGNDVNIAPKVGIYTVNHVEEPVRRAHHEIYAQPVTIEDGVWIGGGVNIVGGVTIGKNAIIGAGSVVTKDIPANVVAAGNPAKVIQPLKTNS